MYKRRYPLLAVVIAIILLAGLRFGGPAMKSLEGQSPPTCEPLHMKGTSCYGAIVTGNPGGRMLKVWERDLMFFVTPTHANELMNLPGRNLVKPGDPQYAGANKQFMRQNTNI